MYSGLMLFFIFLSLVRTGTEVAIQVRNLKKKYGSLNYKPCVDTNVLNSLTV